jgi:hypothetical protein
MSEGTEPTYHTGIIWGVLALLLTLGTVAAAAFVYGVTDLFSTGRYFPDVPILVVGGVAASYIMLLITGILYRIDRLRGVPHRRIEFFE